MKIRDDNGMPRSVPPRPRSVQGPQADPKSTPSPTAGSVGDRVELSDRARKLQVAREALSQLPEVRQEKVQALKQLVKSGAYEVPGEKVAERMLGEGLFA